MSDFQRVSSRGTLIIIFQNSLLAVTTALAVLILVLFFSVTKSYAANKTFTGPGNFSDETKWDSGLLPVAGDNLSIDGICTFDDTAHNLAYGNLEVSRNNAGSIVEWPSGGSNTLNVASVVTGTAGAGTIDMSNGGYLQIRAGWSSSNTSLTQGSGTVEYTNAGIQTVTALTYNNLTLSGSGAKTFPAGTTTVDGVLTMQGTATATLTGTLIYGASAALRYNRAAAQSSGAEWITPFNATGGIIISNSGTITLNAAKVLNTSVPLTIDNSAALSTGNFGLTFGGDFINNGTFTGGSAPVVIAGTALTQSIAGFTTTGTVSLTKTAGTATFTGNVNGGAFTLNGNGGTLDLGEGLTHTFTGAWTRTDGTLNCSSSALNIGGTTTNTGGTFSAGTGKVNYNRAGSQTIANVTYNNLTLSGTSAKTFPAGTTTVNGVLSMEGTATVTLTGTLIYSPSATLQYNRTSDRATGSEWITPFNATGGIVIANTGIITLSAAKVLGASVSLTINNGSTLSITIRGLTFGGDFINNGTFSATSAPIVITGTAESQSISGFTTTGAVSMTKSAGTATFTGNVNGGAFTLNGSGGTLDFGEGFTHTFTGAWTRTDGTLICNSSALTIGGTTTNTGGTFTAGTGTVIYNGTGAQTIANVTFNNLALSGNSIKTFPLGTTIVNSVFSTAGIAGITFSGDFVYNAGPIDYGSIPIVISGTQAAQSFAGFTTTGSVSMTKTAGTATFTGNVNGGAFTLNGNGGTLDLGNGLTHTFTGTWTRSNGSLLGNSSTLNIGGGLSGTGGTFTAGSSTVNYNADGAQTIAGVTYNNLTTIGSGVKTLNGGVIVNGDLTIGNNTTIATGNNTLTFRGNFINDGTFTAGSSAIIITGSGTQSISGLTTTGSVSMTKTAGTATFTGNVNGGAFTLNGNGGTLDLGEALTHTFTGTWTRTNGTLICNSSTLNIGGGLSGTGGTFTAGSSTVNYNADGAQTIAGVTYNNLTTIGSGVKTLNGGVIVNGDLTIGNNTTLATSNNALTFGGNFINDGTFTAGSSAIIITGSGTQSISGLNTTGTVSMTKTAGTATFTGNVNGGAFTLNGNGGTLDLGNGLTHTFTGTWTRTNGALICNSSTLSIGGTTTNTGGTFTPGSGTVIYNGSGSQTIANVTYNNLTLSGNSIKTFPPGTVTINGILSVDGVSGITITGNFANNGGPVNCGITPVVISGTQAAQSIAGFTTSGTVSMTKTAGTATFTGDVNGGAFTLSGNGGTLDLGESLTHTFAGTWTRSNGTLFGNSSTLNIGGGLSGTGGTFTASSSTVNYNADGAQTIAGITYYNLTTNGSDVKTLGGVVNVNGDITIGNGTTLATSNRALTFGGNFINDGTFTAGSSSIIITGSGTQSIAGFITTGTVSMTKTAGTATFTGNVSGGAFTLNGGGGTLDLGTDLTHTFTGAWTRTDGTLICNSSTLTVGGITTNTSGTFIEGTGIVIYNGTGAQTIANVSYNNLTLSGNSIKTFPLGTVTINGVLSVDGIAGITITGNFVNNGGSINYGSAPVVISGAELTQSIAGFTTTGTVSMTKTAGTATFTGNVNGGAFTLSGNGGTLDLGEGLTHIFTGKWTRTNGALLGNSSTLNIGGTSTNTGGTFTAGTSTINYYAAGAQTIARVTYNNLTLSGSGAKTFPTGITTVNGVLTMQDTATSTLTGTLTYGESATLKYNTATGRTAGAEWYNTFNSTGGIIISNTGTITLNAAKVLDNSVPLTIENGATLAAGNFGLTFGGNFINNGAFNGGSSPVVIAGTALTQSIDGFTTTSTVSLTKTGGTAIFTGNVNGGSLNLNGNGGTLDLGAGLTHTFTGAWSRTNGTLLGNSSTLNIGGTTTNTAGIFIAGTGTINYNASGPQTLANVAYNNLTLSGSGIKTTTDVTVNGILSIEGTATVSSPVTYGALAALQYNTSSSRNAGEEWISPFTATGGVVIVNTGTITMNEAKVFNDFIPLIINNGATLDSGNFGLTLGGEFINNGTFNSGTTTVTLNGATQNLGGSTIATFNNLTINNSNEVVLNNNININGELVLTDGIIKTGAYFLNVSSTGSVSRTNGYICGNLRKELTTGPQSFTFDIGDISYYTPVTLSFDNITGNGHVTVNTTPNEHLDISASGINPGKNVNRFWTLTSGGGISYTTYGATFTFDSADVDITAAIGNFVVRQYNGSIWTSLPIAARTPTTIQISGISSMSDFLIGEQELDHFDFNLAEDQTDSIAFIGTNILTAKDFIGETVTAFDASANNVAITSNPNNGTITGLGSGNNNVLNQLSDFTDGVAVLTGKLLFSGVSGNHIFSATSANNKNGASNTVLIKGALLTVQGGLPSLVIENGDHSPFIDDATDYGHVDVLNDEKVEHTFKIKNPGFSNLKFKGTPLVKISGANAGDFIVTLHPSSTVAINDSTEFKVAFDPSGGGIRTALISIENNDGTKNPFEFSIQGAGDVPDIDVLTKSTYIRNGYITPSLTDFTDFGTVKADDSVAYIFTIRNSGAVPLRLTGTPFVEISGDNHGDFVVTSQPSNEIINADDVGTFQLTFKPSADSLRTALVSIKSNVAEKSPYTFMVQGSGKSRVDLISPNGPEKWFAGGENLIQWYSKFVETIKLEFSPDGGESWNLIASGIPDSLKKYSWTLPDAVSTQTIVRISDVSDSEINDRSDNVFSIRRIFPPSNLTASDDPEDNGHRINLSWTLSADDDIIDGYRLFRSRKETFTEPVVDIANLSSLEEIIASEQTSAILIAEISSGETEFSDNSVPLNGVEYYYWIQSYKGTSSSAKVQSGKITSVAEEKPLSYSVNTPYPNPFNPRTSISYTIPIAGHVSLMVYSLAGQKVATLIDGIIEPGKHEVIFDGSGHASGVYLYRFESGDFSKTGKMLLMK